MRIGSVLVTALAVIALAFGGMARVSAQEGPLASTGFPELSITLTDAGLEGVPAETAAGWYLVTFTNSITPTGDPFDDAWAVEFIQVPEGMTAEEVAYRSALGYRGAKPAPRPWRGSWPPPLRRIRLTSSTKPI